MLFHVHDVLDYHYSIPLSMQNRDVRYARVHILLRAASECSNLSYLLRPQRLQTEAVLKTVLSTIFFNPNYYFL